MKPRQPGVQGENVTDDLIARINVLAQTTSKKQSKETPPAPKNVAPLPGDAFTNPQLTLFQAFLANSTDQRSALSNAVDLWDSVPRYTISRTRMTTLRDKNGDLDALSIPFTYRGRSLTAVIHPVRLKIDDKLGNKKFESYYPSAREELIEHALRKLAAEQQCGFYDQSNYRSGVRFSLHQLRKELARRGHTLRYDQLIEGLDILSMCAIEIRATNSDGEEAFRRSNYLPALSGVQKADFEANRDAKWVAQFHPLLSRGIDQVTYRQYNYDRLMRCKTQIARWLIAQLVLKFVAASLGTTFVMRYSTIKRDSALLDGYAQERDAFDALKEAWEEIKELGVLSRVDIELKRGARGKLEEGIYTIYATKEFVGEQKAANRRLLDAKGIAELQPA